MLAQNCGQVRQWQITPFNLNNGPAVISPRPGTTNDDNVERKHASVRRFSSDKHAISVDYPAAFRTGENVLFPTFEGNISGCLGGGSVRRA